MKNRCAGCTAETGRLQNFAEPSAQWRPVVFWSWNDRLNLKELKRQILAFARAGYGGFFMHSRVGRATDYLSEEWFSLARDCVDFAKKHGLSAWIYDEDMWPSGYAGGEIPKLGEACRERFLIAVDFGNVLPEDRVLCAPGAAPDKRIVLRTRPLGNPRFNGGCYVDTFNPRVTEEFLRSTHEKYAEALGTQVSKKVSGVFTDEPCMGMVCFHEQPALPFSEILFEAFREKKGYDLADHAEELFFDTGDFRKVRFDYRDVASEQFRKGFFDPYADWCRRHGLLFTGHVMGEDTLLDQTKWVGSAMPIYEKMDLPGADKLFRHFRETLLLKQLTSVKEQLGKDRALCECFAGIGHEDPFQRRKAIVDRLALCGIDFVNPHLSHYSLRGERKRDYPPTFSYQQPCFEAERIFSDYAARLSVLAGAGKSDASVLVIHPIASVWAEFAPGNAESEERIRREYDRPFDELVGGLSDGRVGFHLGDETLLARYAEAGEFGLVMGDYRYDTVILPPMLTIGKATVALLNDFARFDGRVLALGRLPTLLDGVTGSFEWKIAQKFDSLSGLLAVLKADFVRVRISRSDGTDASGIRSAVRELESGTLFLFANGEKQDETEAVISMRVPDGGTPFALCLSDGMAYDLSEFSVRRGSEIELRTTFCQLGSLAVLVADASDLAGFEISPSEDSVWELPDGVRFKPRSHELQVHDVRIETLDENVLVLDRCFFSLDGRPCERETYTAELWHSVFYPAPEGTPFCAEFIFEVETVPQSVFAAIENAENLDRILVNGREVVPLRTRGEAQTLDEKAWLDVSFSRVDLNGTLRLGRNVLRIEGRKYNHITGIGTHGEIRPGHEHFTEIENVYLVGSFGVWTRDGGTNYFIGPEREHLTTGDLGNQGYPFYAGRISAEFDSDAERIRLEAPDIAAVECFVEGKSVGSRGFAPYSFGLGSDEGARTTKRVRMVCYGDLFNLLGPNRIKGYDELAWVDPGVFNDVGKFSERILRRPFGIGKIWEYGKD